MPDEISGPCAVSPAADAIVEGFVEPLGVAAYALAPEMAEESGSVKVTVLGL